MGIDIEEIKHLSFSELKMFFTDTECDKIEQSYNSTISFYKHWTQKESFLKAIGMGLYIPINQVEILENKIRWDKNDWWLKEIELDEKYISYVSHNTPISKIIMERIKYS